MDTTPGPDDLPIEDALEQQQAVAEESAPPDYDPSDRPLDADPADVWEQQIEVPDDEDELRDE